MPQCSTILTLTQTVAPAKEPITLAEAKAQCRIDVDVTAHDTELTNYIKAARALAEAYQNRQLITATYTATLEDFPSLYGHVPLPRPPIQSITSITYTDTSGNTGQTVSGSNYTLVKGSVSGVVVPAYQTAWPDVYAHEGAENVTVTFVAGYGDDPGDVPDTTRQAIRMLVADMFENHEAHGTDTLRGNPTAEMLLNLNRIPPVA